MVHKSSIAICIGVFISTSYFIGNLRERWKPSLYEAAATEVKINHESPQFWATNKNGEIPLRVAARVGCGEVVTFLIDSTKLRPIEGVDPEKKSIDGQAYKKLL
ncbi:hypothetical protein DVH24_021818 [Malus domestica]|uniref:Uncharacterized protein n=1 Tax=Malus domestica TaxID=3750 RepID=A0A498IW85_MALDO|nr:hypothetical protein DVH24_021818 [Malus domestica]